MSDRARRIGANEALYRTVNEKIEGLNATFGSLMNTMSVVCECGSLSCSEQVEIALPDYERVRADPALFVVVPGHEEQDVETVIERADGYDVVRKAGGLPERIAEETDPRS